MLRRTVGLAAAITIAAAAPAQAAKVEHLSRPGKESFFAFVEKAEVVRSQPKASARKVSKLTRKSPEGTDDLVLGPRPHDGQGQGVAAGAAADPAQRDDRVGAGDRAQRAPARGHVAEDLDQDLQGHADQGRQDGLQRARSASASRSGRPRRASSTSAPSSRSTAAPARSTGRSRSSPARPRRR